MKLTVFGATGRTGRHVVEQGLCRGHQITAFTRRPHTLDDPTALAAVVQGDGRDVHAVRTAIDGANAVISTVAPAVRNDQHRLADVTQVIIRAMTQLGVRRLVVASAYPITVDKPSLGMAVLRRLLAAPYADGAAMARVVEASELDWTIAYLNRLTTRPANGRIRTSRGPLAKPRAITRADAAGALLDIVEDASLARTAVNVSGA